MSRVDFRLFVKGRYRWPGDGFDYEVGVDFVMNFRSLR